MTTITIPVRPILKAQRKSVPDNSTLWEYGNAVFAVPSSDTFSLPGATYERQDGKLDVRRNSAQDLYNTKWFTPTFDTLVTLSWNSDTRITDSRPTQRAAVAGMLTILIEVLDSRTPPPSVVPTWNGGVQVEWHRNGVDLEIEVSPAGDAEYFFSSPDEEREGMAWDEIERLTKYARSVL